MSLAVGQRLGSYEILGLLGAGGMGEVYRARDTKLHRDVAIKVIPAGLADDPVARTRFEAESCAVAALSHPNIIAIFDAGSDGGTFYSGVDGNDDQGAVIGTAKPSDTIGVPPGKDAGVRVRIRPH